MVAAAFRGNASGMTTTPPLVRFSALAAPILLLLYGLLRWVDGLDGEHGPGLAWDVGHTLFLIAFRPARCRDRRPAAAGFGHDGAVAGHGESGHRRRAGGSRLLPVAILGDLFPDFDDALPVPDAVQQVGPLLFQLGTLTLLVILASVRPRRLPAWSPVLVLARLPGVRREPRPDSGGGPARARRALPGGPGTDCRYEPKGRCG